MCSPASSSTPKQHGTQPRHRTHPPASLLVHSHVANAQSASLERAAGKSASLERAVTSPWLATRPANRSKWAMTFSLSWCLCAKQSSVAHCDSSVSSAQRIAGFDNARFAWLRKTVLIAQRATKSPNTTCAIAAKCILGNLGTVPAWSEVFLVKICSSWRSRELVTTHIRPLLLQHQGARSGPVSSGLRVHRCVPNAFQRLDWSSTESSDPWVYRSAPTDRFAQLAPTEGMSSTPSDLKSCEFAHNCSVPNDLSRHIWASVRWRLPTSTSRR